MEFSLLEAEPHHWPLHAALFDDGQWTVEFTRSVQSTLQGTLAGIVWRSRQASKLFVEETGDLVSNIIAEVTKMGAGSDIIVLVEEAVKYIVQWNTLVQRADESNSIDLGLARLPVAPESADIGLKHDNKHISAFQHGVAGAVLVDTIFWLLDGKAEHAVELPPRHPLYATNPIPAYIEHKHIAHVCHRLGSWEYHIVKSEDVEARQKASTPAVDVSKMKVSAALQVLCTSRATWQWGKILRNAAAVAMGLRLLHQPVS